jgi:hypothetical protein
MPLTGYGYLDDFLKEIRGQKAAGTKVAEPLSEPGGYQGQSTHPSADAPDNLIKSRTGARAAENTADIKDDRESPMVDDTAEVTADSGTGTPKQDEHQLNIGTEESSTGADPSVEDDYKGTKDDPGTTHPMKADDGQKYAQYKAMPFQKLASHCIDLGNGLLADIATGAQKRAASNGVPVQRAGAGVTQRLGANGAPAGPAIPGVSQEVKLAAEQGYQLAAELGHTENGRAAAGTLIEATVKEAATSAVLLTRFLAQVQKQAADDDAQKGEDHSQGGDSSSGAGDGSGMGGPPAAGGAGGPPVDPGAEPPMPAGGGPPGVPPGLAAALGGGGPAGGPAIDGNSPPGGPMGPGGPGDPGGAGGPVGPGGPQPSPEQALQELAAALMEMGIDPAQLAQVAQQMQAGAGGDTAKAAEAHNLQKAAKAVIEYRKSGKFGFTPAKTAQQEALRGHMRAYVAEALRLAS